MRADEILMETGMMRRIILANYRRDSCIASTAILIAVLDEFGIKSEALSVKLIGYNRQYVEWLKPRKWDDSPTREDAKMLVARGARMIAVGFGHERDLPDPTKWAGHLAVAIKPRNDDLGYLADLSADQAHRPEKGIPIPEPLVCSIAREAWRPFVTGKTFMHREQEDGSVLMYAALPADASYADAPDWINRKARHHEIVTEIVKGLRAERIA